jgi:MraZ protein
MLMTGMFHRSLDDKLRFAVPKPLRDAMDHPRNSVLYMAPGTDGSLELYTEKIFGEVARQLESGPRHDRRRRAFSRVFYSQVQRVEMDRQGRVRLPLELARHAGISKEIVLVGVRDHVELWDRGRWEQYFDQTQPHFDELAEELSPGSQEASYQPGPSANGPQQPCAEGASYPDNLPAHPR